MKPRGINFFKMFIAILVFMVGLEAFFILRSVFDIKSGNSRLRGQLEELKIKNRQLIEENKNLNDLIRLFQQPEFTPPDVPAGNKVFRNLYYGYEISYPGEGAITFPSEVSTEDRQKQLENLRINYKDTGLAADINIYDLKKYKSIGEYIKVRYDYKIYVKESVFLNNQKYDIYKLSGEKHYYVILKGKYSIVEINSASQELLMKIAAGFKFI